MNKYCDTELLAIAIWGEWILDNDVPMFFIEEKDKPAVPIQNENLKLAVVRWCADEWLDKVISTRKSYFGL